jgi:hypothetical protein
MGGYNNMILKIKDQSIIFDNEKISISYIE